jgi:hypothetical protein
VRLFQVPGRGRDDGSGHYRARDYTLAVDHPKRVAFTCHRGRRAAPFIPGHLAASQSQPTARVKHSPEAESCGWP